MTVYYKGFPQSTREEKIDVVNLSELEDEAKNVIPEAAYYYIASGSEDEWTFRNNTQAFKHWQIVPRALTGIENPQLDTDFMGISLKTPITISPIACHGIAHADAEVGTAKGAKNAGALFSMSTYCNKSVEDVAAATGDSPKFFQLYLSKDWEFNKMVITAAKDAGFKGFYLTVDATVSGYREANLRTNFTYPVALDFFQRWSGGKGEGQSVAAMYDSSAQNIGPDDIKKIKEIANLPVFVKGVECVEDAFKAIGAGADGIVVSNHGGREVDTAPATIDVLPEISKEIKKSNKRIPIVLDSGVRRGSDVFKALALGADLVGIGRPYLYGLALGGSLGVESVINQLNNELLIDMQLTGCKTIEDIKHAKINHGLYSADWGISSTSKGVKKPYPVTEENQLKNEGVDAASGASKH